MKRLKFNKKIFIRLLIVSFVIFGFVFLITNPDLSLPYRPPKVTSVNPPDGKVDVLNRTIIQITFDKQVPLEEQGNFYLRLLPGVAGSTVWNSPNTVSFIPERTLESSTTYKFALSHSGNLLFESQFTTRVMKVYSDEELDDIREWSFATSRAMYETFKDYPFLKYLPLTSDSYVVTFDSDLNQFRYYLKMDKGVPDATKEEAIKAATLALVQIGVNVEDYGYYLYFPNDREY